MLDLAVKISLSSSYNFKISSCSLGLKKCALSFFLMIWKSAKTHHKMLVSQITTPELELVVGKPLTIIKVHSDRRPRSAIALPFGSQRARAVIRDVSMLDLVIKS